MMQSLNYTYCYVLSASGESPGDFCKDQKQSQQKSHPSSEEQFCDDITNSSAQRWEF